MNHQELLEIIQDGESSSIEFKTEDVKPGALAEEIVAFANFKGGLILLGVDDDGEIQGCQRDDLEEFVVNVCRNNVRPSIIPDIKKFVIDGNVIYGVAIPEGDGVAATNNGKYYIRVGSTKQIPTQQELLRLFQKRKIIQFDESPVFTATINNLDVGKINDYLSRMGQSPLDDDDPDALKVELLNLSVVVEQDDVCRPTLGGVLAFGKNPSKHFPSYVVEGGAYKGTDVTAEVISEKIFNGSLADMIEDTMAFFKLVLPQRQRMERGIQRVDEYAYPLEALREAVVNAVCHRDYTISGSTIRVLVFDDRLEIRSPGGLPNTLTLQSMIYRQFTRNQMIASFLTGYGYMEKRGKGVARILKSCQQAGVQCDLSLAPGNDEFVVTMGKLP